MPRATRFALWTAVAALALALALAACGQDTSGEQDAPPAQDPAPSEDPTWYDQEERDALDAAGDDIVWVTGWFAPEALEGLTVADLEPRYRRGAGLAPDADMTQRAQAAFAALGGEGPVDLINPLEGVTLRLLGARVEDRDGRPTAVLDFDEGIAATTQLGGTFAAEAEVQFHAMVAEYFPDAVAVVVTVEGADAELFDGRAYGEPVELLR